MALIACPECESQVSDKATACIKCGCPITPSGLKAQPEVSAPVNNASSSSYQRAVQNRCNKCNAPLDPEDTKCFKCGTIRFNPNRDSSPSSALDSLYAPRAASPRYSSKDRTIYVVLGLFLGGLGVHNFYSGHTGRGLAKLLMTIFLFWTIAVPVGVLIWTIIELITTTEDAEGNAFA
jgi:TM2 domain-containing membrane protein YozV/ribosomal protein L40E